MQLMICRCLIVCLMLVAAVSAYAEKSAPVIREEQIVVVDGVEERWSLEWASAPSPECSPESDVWETCPCIGFAFGERGELSLVRKRPGQEDERLPLGKLFQETPGFTDAGDRGEAVLRRWDVQEKDWDEKDAPDFAARVKARPNAKIMRFGDYDQDGRATEFILQIEVLPCGKRMCVAIGISRSNPHLHVLSSVERPGWPLVLQVHQWEALLEAKGPVKVMHWRCGDHAYDQEDELELHVDGDGIHAMMSIFECSEDGVRGRFLRKCVLGDAVGCREDKDK